MSNAHAKKNKYGQKTKKRLKKIAIALILLLFLLVAVVLVLHKKGYFWYPWEEKVMVAGRAEKGPLPGMTQEELLAYMQKNADENNSNIQLNAKPIFKNGNSEGSLMLQNSHFNKYDMMVTIYEGKGNTGRLLYESEKIQPDYHILNDKLKIALPKGDHPATAYVAFYDGEKRISMASFTIEISIEN